MGEDLLQMLIPMMMVGNTDLRQLFARIIGGMGASQAVGGMEALAQRQLQDVARLYPASPNMTTIMRGAESFVDAMGYSPYSGTGQGMANLITRAYRFMPNEVGKMIGVYDPKSFFGPVVNGFRGIGSAAGMGNASMFDPYSIRDSYAFARDRAQQMYDFAVDEKGGYRTQYTHGLNMGDLGLVSQRILSARDTYINPDTGGTYSMDDNKDAEAFKNRLKQFGEKINRFTSMVNKVTGSMQETLDFMDRLAGGDFLGGSQKQAEETARKAANIATAVRTSAIMAGRDPTEAFREITGAQVGMAMRMGWNPTLARSTGFADVLNRPATSTTVAYNMWKAQNPNANQAQQERAYAGIAGRATAFAGSPAHSMAIIASYYRNQGVISEEQADRIEKMLEAGRGDEVEKLLKETIGSRELYAAASNPGILAGMTSNMDKDLYNRLFAAGANGNTTQAIRAGADMKKEVMIGEVGKNLARLTGSGIKYSDQQNARLDALKKLAKDKGILTDAQAERFTRPDKLEELLQTEGVDPEEISRAAAIGELEMTEQKIDAATMGEEQKRDVYFKLENAVSSSGLTEKTKNSLIKALQDENVDMAETYRRFLKMENPDMSPADMDKKVVEMFGGKITEAAAKREKARIKQLKDYNSTEATEEEKAKTADLIGAYEAAEARQQLFKAYNSEDLADNTITDRMAVTKLSDKIRDINKSGAARISKDDPVLTEATREAVLRTVGDVMGDDVAGVKGEALDEIKKSIRDRALGLMDNGKSLGEAISIAISSEKDKIAEKAEANVSGNDEDKKAARQRGMDAAKYLSDKSKTDENTSRRALMSKIGSVITENSSFGGVEAAKEDILSGRIQIRGGESTALYEVTGKEIRKYLEEQNSKLVEKSSTNEEEFNRNKEELDKIDWTKYAREAYENGFSEANGNYDVLKRFGLQQMPESVRREIAKDKDAQKALTDAARKEILGAADPKKVKEIEKAVRESNFAELGAIANPKDAASVMTQVAASKTLMGGGSTFMPIKDLEKMGQELSKGVQALDDEQAGKQNNLRDAIAGPGSNAERDLQDVQERLLKMQNAIQSAGIQDANALRDALADPNSEKGRALGGVLGDTKEEQDRNRAILNAASTSKIGGVDVLDQMFNQGGLKTLVDKAGDKEGGEEAKKGWADIARQAGRENSDSYKILDTLTKLADKIIRFIDATESSIKSRGIGS